MRKKTGMRKSEIDIRKKLLLAVGAPVVFFLLLEGILWLCGYGHPTSFTVQKAFDGKEYHVANPWFTARFFPKQNPRLPVPFAIPVEKPENSLRLLVLGASAAQGDPKPEFGFSRMLDRMLTGQFPERPVEVYNFGITAINSHVDILCWPIEQKFPVMKRVRLVNSNGSINIAMRT